MVRSWDRTGSGVGLVEDFSAAADGLVAADDEGLRMTAGRKAWPRQGRSTGGGRLAILVFLFHYLL